MSSSTVTWKACTAAPPEFRAVTVTVSESATSVGMLIVPLRASTEAPAPVTVKRRASPLK